MANLSHPHGGHRARLRKRMEAEGLGAFEPHEVLELLLYTTIPQRDVNPLAHALIERFGSVAGVLGADPMELAKVRGMGGRSAEFLSFLNQLTKRYAELRLNDRPKISSVRQMSKHCSKLFEPETSEETWLLSMNMAGHLLGSTQLCTGDWQKKLTLRQAVEPALKYNAQTTLLLMRHNHGELKVRDAEVDFVNRLAKQFALVRIRLVDGAVMFGYNVMSLRHAGLYKLEDVENEDRDSAHLCEHWLDEI